MSVWVFMAVPAAALVFLLVHDFMAGLGEDRLWADPSISDSESFRSRAARSPRIHPDAVSMDSIGKLAGDFREREEDASMTAEKSQAWPA